MARITGDDLQEQRVIDDVKNYGWHCVSIGAEDDLPPFTFTIGLFHNFKHPELIIFGLGSNDESCYKGTIEGAIITVMLFGIYEGSAVSREFALYLGISDVWDFNQHKIDPSKVDRAGLMDFGNKYPDYAKDCASFLTLLDHDYEFHFIPNG